MKPVNWKLVKRRVITKPDQPLKSEECVELAQEMIRRGKALRRVNKPAFDNVPEEDGAFMMLGILATLSK